MPMDNATALMHMNMGDMRRFNELTVLHGEENITGAVQEVPVVGDDDMGMRMACQNMDEMGTGGGIKIVGGFIEEQGFGSHGHNGGEGHHFFFAARKLVGNALGEVLEIEEREGVEGGLACFIGCQAEIERTKGHIFEHGRAEELVVTILKKKAKIAAEGGKGWLQSLGRFFA